LLTHIVLVNCTREEYIFWENNLTDMQTNVRSVTSSNARKQI